MLYGAVESCVSLCLFCEAEEFFELFYQNVWRLNIYPYIWINKNETVMYYRIFTVEESGNHDTCTFKSDGNIEAAKAEYIAMRLVQSQKGFKRPMPKEVSIEFN